MELYTALGQEDGNKHRQNLLLLNASALASSRTAFMAAAPGVLDGTEGYVLIPSGPSNSRTTIIQDYNKNQVLVIGNGTTGIDNVPALISGWTFPGSGSNGIVKPWADAIAVMMPYLTPSGHSPWSNVTLIGHSYGGASMMCLAVLMKNAYPSARLQTWTYGAPKHASRVAGNPWRNMYIVRVWTPLDPVPQGPPTLFEGPLLYAANPALPRGLSGDLYQSVTGYQLEDDGDLIAVTNTAAPIVPIPIALAAWVVGVNYFGAAQHSLAYYTSHVAMTPGFTDAVLLPVAQPNVFPRVPRPPAAQEHRLLIQALANEGLATQANPGQAVANAQAVVTPVKGEKYRRSTTLGVRMITYAGVPVVVCANKREQKRVLRELNRSLKFSGNLP